MTLLTAVLFALGLGLLLPFPLYALGMQAWARRPLRRTTQQKQEPAVSVIVVARDAEEIIAAKLRNLLLQDYPTDRLEIIVYTDGCRDATAQRARAVSSKVRVIEGEAVRGKIHGMNRAVRAARHEILVFSDADALLTPGSLQALTGYFHDDAVGGVCGRRVIAAQGAAGLSQSQSDYIDLDSRIKLAENRLGSISSNDGKLFALRAGLYSDLPEAVSDDLYASMQVVGGGYRFMFAPEATVMVDLPSRTLAHEFARRRRIVSTSLRGIWRMRVLLNPLAYHGYALRLLLNKVMRRLMPLGLLPLAAAIALSLPGTSVALALVTVLLLNAYPCLQRPAIRYLIDRLAYPLVGLMGTLGGLLDLATGRAPTHWNPRGQATAPADRDDRPRIAYSMSRFPKVTETFVLYEILEMERAGIDVSIFPLLLERENTRHPEVMQLMPKVHFAPFLNFAILRANLCWLTASPVRFLRAWTDALRIAWPNRNFLLGALGVLPKAAWYARQMQTLQIAHLHAHFATHPALAARFIHALTGIPYSFTAHGHDIHISLRGFDAKARDARFWVTISRYNLDLLAQAFGPAILAKAHLIHCGIDLTRITWQAPQRTREMFNILCVASLKEVKGHRYLVEACAELQRNGIAFHCHLIGDGPLRGEIEVHIAQVGLCENFTLHGQQPQPRVLQAMQACDVVVLPSILASRGDREGIPVCLMEAMASGRPVVSSRLSGIPELVTSGREGILVPQKDAKALAAALFQLAGDPGLCRRMALAGRAKVEREFDLATNAAQLAALINGSVQHRNVQDMQAQGSARNSRKAL